MTKAMIILSWNQSIWGPGWRSLYRDLLRVRRSGDRIPVGREIFRTRSDRPWGPPSLLYKGYRFSFPAVKRPGRGVDHPPHLAPRLTRNLLMLYMYGAPCKTWNFNVVYIWTYVSQRWKPSLSICCTTFQHWINAENYPVAQLCVNTLLSTKVTLITNGI
jgi:hypothetical protein